jgi:Helitron helicase-like domain at N-terminus/PIF1-like helicase
MQQDICLKYFQASHCCLDGIPGVPVYDPVPVPTSPLWEVSAAQLRLNGHCSAVVDLFHKTGVNIVEIVFPRPTYNVIDVIYILMLLRQTFDFIIQPFAHHFFVFLQSPYFVSICASYHKFFLSVTLMHSVLLEEPCVLSYLAFLCVSRNMFLKHDFLARVARFFTTPHIPLPWLFLAIEILLSCQYLFQITSIQRSSSSCFTSANSSSQRSAAPFDVDSSHNRCITVGGGRQHTFTFEEIGTHIIAGRNVNHDSAFNFIDHVDSTDRVAYPTDQNFVYANVPLPYLLPYLSLKMGLKIAKLHHISLDPRIPKFKLNSSFLDHDCASCNLYCSVFSVVASKAAKDRNRKHIIKVEKSMSPVSEFPDKRCERFSDLGDVDMKRQPIGFPPMPVDNKLSHKIISDFCENLTPNALEEAGCAVCGQLVPVTQLTKLKAVKNLLHVLHASGVTRLERSLSTQPIREIKGPVLDYTCNRICDNCRQCLRNGKAPPYALASGLWLGAIPEVLSSLTYIERLLVARVRINSCFIRVASSGLRKMASHVIAFESPVPKIYHKLPPPIEDLDEVLAILFTGPCKPTEKEFQRTPLLVRRNHVAHALEWLRLNHSDYADLEIAYDELYRYPEDSPPVSVHYRHSLTNKTAEGTSIFDDALDDGVEQGDCPFVVHGLMGDQLDTKTITALKGAALRHWNNRGGALAVSHDASPQSFYNNPHLYPQIFPWLFPYGLGGIGATKLSEKSHKHRLLMYHDKRFQRDVCFPFVAFSHQQIKASTTGGFLLAETQKFNEIANRLLNVNQTVLENIAKRMSDGEVVKPSTEDESACFQLIRDLDHVDGKVSGSITSKKYMRSELWSLIAYLGAPVWYITLSPADNKHPICLYFADNKEKLDVALSRSEDERYRLIASNPVAGARFFHFMIKMFIYHVLGIKKNHHGLYGETAGYYGTVEQQGRLTLHLHMLLWIRGSPSPDELRSKILDPESEFRQKLVEYLENAHAGDFLLKNKADVEADVHVASQSPEYKNPTETLPEPPPLLCHDIPRNDCSGCVSVTLWWSRFQGTVNDLLLKSNVHKCSSNRNKDGSQNKARPYKGCLDNIWGRCKARFPRTLFEKTEVDMETGRIDMKKRESWLNTFTYLVTYLFRCNTDITSLRSGTAIKGVLLYVSNYVTKPALKTHVIFETVRSTFQKHSNIIGGSDTRNHKARKLMTRIVNSLSAKMEIGSPMACMYLLGNPDHYTDHTFVPFYWQSFVQEARKPWELKSADLDTNIEHPEKLTIFKCRGRIIGFSPVHDYVHRPAELHSMCLYDWISRCQREKRAKKKQKKKTTQLDIIDTNVAVDDSESDHDCSLVEQDKSCLDTGVLNTSKSKFLPFLSSHPLAQTHGVRLLKLRRVPNFIGNMLPRRDQGDHEYYCSAMLTLFKPWRSGLDLKTSKFNSWYETFMSHGFTMRQLELMKNMNIRYECLDARDDFHTQFKKGATSEIPGWSESGNGTGIFNDLDQMAVEDAINGPAIIFDEFSISPISGRREKTCTGLMTDMRRMLVSLGWTECNANLLPDGLNLSPDPLEPQTPAHWKATVSKKRAEILEERAHHRPSNNELKAGLGSSSFVPNDVRVVDKAYMTRSFFSKEWQKTVDSVSNEFKLNKEQERAFRIVANHACSPDSEQLKMNIAGMAGTGKTQVLKALVEFFRLKNESHRFIIVAPTGSAAALLQGSTYHSMFGINSDGKRSSGIQLAQVKERLEGVHYIFLDEVSMLSCRDMYLISARLARVMNNLDAPFGGLNIIFAGDFAQLPPVIGHENASLYSRSVGNNPTALRHQEAAIGKALWHQVTTVVILRQNMRQRTQSADDAKFREALSNMRYKSCTPADIAFLRTLISSEMPGRSSVNEKQFRNVSIITNLNSQKDEINRLGGQRFAKETGQNLMHFFSIDTVPSSNESEGDEQKNKFTTHRKRSIKYNSIPAKIQEALWEQPTCANTKLIPGKLSICLGMPIMIRNNAATEMCITKGQEAIVHAWDSHKAADGRDVLDTLFVELTNPPTPVKLDGLPLNVIPLTRTSVTTSCRLPDDTSLTVSRSQVEALPNFAMTDYASQGKTRPYNVVDLSQCRSHQSYYTALSRSATAAGTLILNTIHPSKITGGASGALRQEFRELELLDNITTLIFNEKLPRKVAMGDRRNILIDQFREYKGKSYIPSTMHQAIRWSKSDPFLEWQECVDWRIINSKTDRVQVSANLNLPVPLLHTSSTNKTLLRVPPSTPDVISRLQGNVSPVKRKISYAISTEKKRRIKKIKFSHLTASDDPSKLIRLNIPLGTRWQNNSCAYDAVITLLFNIWREDAVSETRSWSELHCELLDSLTECFHKHEDIQVASASIRTFSLEDIRDFIRRRLARFSAEFTFGRYTSVHSVTEQLLKTHEPITTSNLCCPNGHITDRNPSPTSNCELIVFGAPFSLQAYVDNFTVETAAKCSTCNTPLSRVTTFIQTPPLLAFDLGNNAPVLDPVLWLSCQDTQRVRYSLRGIIYFKNGHFTERVITRTGMVWFHDGMFTGRSLLYETDNLSSITSSKDDSDAVMVFYARDPIRVENLQV